MAGTERFAIFRASDARDLLESGVMSSEPPPAALLDGIMAVVGAGEDQGHRSRVLFAGGGMSLTHAWFKSGFPLPRHSHDGDCLYYVVGGSLRLGTETLGPGDGFFIGAGVPYAYVPGDAGVSVLEFRASEAFDIRTFAGNAAFWNRAAETVRTSQDAWATQTEPPIS